MLSRLCCSLVFFCAGSPVGEESVPGVTPADRPLFCVLAGVLATSVAMVTGQNATSLVLGQFKAWPTLARHSTLGCLFAYVGTAMLLVHAAYTLDRTMDTGVLVVTEEEAFITATFIAAHGVDTHMLTATVVEQTFVHI